MVPNPNKTIENIIQSKSLASRPKEILYDGYFYDVTDFISRHPGGTVIKFFTDPGEDATAAIQQFHHRSINKIHLMLKSFKKRPATDQDYQMDPEKLKRHQALTKDYVNLFLEFQKEGLFKPSYFHITWRLIHCAVLLFLGLWMQSSSSILIKCLGSSLIALGAGQAGWVQHEGGHNSLTGNPKVDKFIQSTVIGFFLGISGGWWNGMHNKHHAQPQRLNRDVDLHTTPLIAFNTKAVKDPKKEGNSFLLQNQAWLLLSIDLFLVVNLWAFYIAPKNAIKRRKYYELLMMSLHWCWSFYFLSFPMLVLAHWLFANYLFGNFTLNHTHLPVTDEHTHWVEYGLVHTADIQESWLVDYWMGYLNYQSIHHLFPTMPQFRNHLCKDRVKALAKKHGLPYNTFGYFEAWKIVLNNLQNVSNDLKSMNL